MKFLIEEFGSHAFYVNFDTSVSSDIRKINYIVSVLDGENGKVTKQKSALFEAKNINEAILKMEAFFEFENDNARENALEPLIRQFSDNKS